MHYSRPYGFLVHKLWTTWDQTRADRRRAGTPLTSRPATVLYSYSAQARCSDLGLTRTIGVFADGARAPMYKLLTTDT